MPGIFDGKGIMRFKHLAMTGAALVGMGTAAFALTGQAQAETPASVSPAAAALEVIKPLNTNLCIWTDGDPTPQNPTTLSLQTCTSNVRDQFYATPSSWGTGWYSIVSNDHAGGGNYCIEGQSSNGGIETLQPCDGLYEQAYKKSCQLGSGGTEIVNSPGFAINDYGGAQKAGDDVVSWLFEQHPPVSLIFNESSHDMGTC